MYNVKRIVTIGVLFTLISLSGCVWDRGRGGGYGGGHEGDHGQATQHGSGDRGGKPCDGHGSGDHRGDDCRPQGH